jgi:hypothetical protein
MANHWKSEGIKKREREKLRPFGSGINVFSRKQSVWKSVAYPFAAIVMSKLKLVISVMSDETVSVNFTCVISFTVSVCPA